MNDSASRLDKNHAKHFILLFVLFFMICFGLGYAILKRYDPRLPRGTIRIPPFTTIW